MSVQLSVSAVDLRKEKLQALASFHACSSHPLFSALEEIHLTIEQAGRLLRNYDAHASVLRRLLLKAASLMPEPAVGYVLENVRNEYGNGDYARNHQYQLQDVAWKAGVDRLSYSKVRVENGVRTFCRIAPEFYNARTRSLPAGLLKPAVTAGAITATEVLAIKEFASLQKAFAKLGLEHHIWFHHVTIEEEHSDESLALALYFIDQHDAWEAVKYGMSGILDANMHLYDGLLATLK